MCWILSICAVSWCKHGKKHMWQWYSFCVKVGFGMFFLRCFFFLRGSIFVLCASSKKCEQSRMVWREVPGATGPITQPLLCVEHHRQVISGIHVGICPKTGDESDERIQHVTMSAWIIFLDSSLEHLTDQTTQMCCVKVTDLSFPAQVWVAWQWRFFGRKLTWFHRETRHSACELQRACCNGAHYFKEFNYVVSTWSTCLSSSFGHWN